jgi:HK97 family phage major capsid protein
MSKIYALREERGTLAKEVRNLLDKHPGKEWGPDQQKVYDAHLERIEALDGAIQREQKAIDLLAAEGQQVERIAEARGVSLGDAKSIAARQREIHVKWLRKGDEGLSAEDRTFIRNTRESLTRLDFGVDHLAVLCKLQTVNQHDYSLGFEVPIMVTVASFDVR